MSSASDESHGDGERRLMPPRVSWFELFYDLVIVAAVAHGGHLLVTEQNFTLGAWLIGTFAISFFLWFSTSLATNVAPGAIPLRKSLMFVQMIAVTLANLALSRSEGLPDNWGFAGLAVAFLTLAIIYALVGRSVSGLRPASRTWGWSAGVAAVILAMGTAVPESWVSASLAVLSIGVLVAFVPALAAGLPQLLRARRVEPEHLAERVGQLVIIVLGESFLGLVLSLEGLDRIPGPTFFVLTFLVAGAYWAIYFTSVFPMGIPLNALRLELWLLGVMAFLVGATYSAEYLASYAAQDWLATGSPRSFAPLPMLYVLAGALVLGLLGGRSRDVRFARIHLVAMAGLMAGWVVFITLGVRSGNVLVICSSAIVMLDAAACLSTQRRRVLAR